MKQKSGVSFGPGAPSLILIFVVLGMSVLGVLSLMNGRNDARLSQRSVQVMESVYALNERAEEKRVEISGLLFDLAGKADTEEARFSALEAALPEGVTLEAGEICWTETDGFRTLCCALEVLPEGRAAWTRHELTAETEQEW